jgi:hypothetical protein
MSDLPPQLRTAGAVESAPDEGGFHVSDNVTNASGLCTYFLFCQ